MAIDKTSRIETLTGNGSSNQVFDVPFAAEDTGDVTVYNPSGNIMREGIDYTVTLNGLPASTANTVRVTWIGTSPSGTVSFYRNSDRLQPVDLLSGYATGEIEKVFDKATLAYQNTMRTTNNVFDAQDGRLQELPEPTQDSDIATVRYAQEQYSKKGYICPPVLRVDTPKCLYAYSTSSVGWKDPFDVPYPAAHNKILKVDGGGDPAWVAPVDYAPTFPTDEEKYLSLDSGLDTVWRTVNQLPLYENGNAGDACVYQLGDTVAWYPIRFLPVAYNQHKYLWNSTGTGADGAVGLVANTTYAAAKGALLDEGDTDANYGGEATLVIQSHTGDHYNPIFEWDLSALTAADYTMDTIVSVRLRLRFTAGSGSARSVIIKRMPDTFVQGTGASGNSFNDDGATWEQPGIGSTDWVWTDGGIADLDHELPVPSFTIGSGVETGDYTYVDMTQLFLDALHRRSGILRIMIYDPDTTGSAVTGTIHSNSGATHQILLEVKNANARTGYWQPCNYKHVDDRSPWSDNHFDMQLEPDTLNLHQPHCARMGIFVTHDDLTGLHTTDGHGVACAYATSESTEDLSPDNEGFMLHEAYHPAGTASGDSVWGFIDRSSEPTGEQAGSMRLRISSIWLENE